MKPFLLLFASLAALAVSIAGAQELPAQAVNLPKPILPKLPAKASWTVITFPLQEASGKQPAASPSPTPALIGKKMFFKSDPLMQIIKIDALGNEVQQWRVGNTQYLVNAGSNDVGVMDPSSEEYIKSDFQDLEWIKPSNFVGIQNFQGKDCWVFTDRVQQISAQDLERAKIHAEESGVPFDSGKYAAKSTAYIDPSTRLPVAVVTDGNLSLYRFDDPPIDKFAIPENVQKKGQADWEREKAMKAGPPRPF